MLGLVLVACGTVQALKVDSKIWLGSILSMISTKKTLLRLQLPYETPDALLPHPSLCVSDKYNSAFKLNNEMA
jgi:hypothetical protein